MMTDARANEETLLMFIARKGNANTGEIARRYGWHVPEAHAMLLALQRHHQVRRVGPADMVWAEQWTLP